MIKKIFIITGICLFSFLGAITPFGSAQTQAEPNQEDVKLLNPLANFQPNSNENAVDFFQGFAGRLIRVLLITLTGLSIIPIVIGGIYMTASSGNQDMVNKGKSSLVWGIIGLVLGLSSFIIYNFFLQLLIQGS